MLLNHMNSSKKLNEVLFLLFRIDQTEAFSSLADPDIPSMDDNAYSDPTRWSACRTRMQSPDNNVKYVMQMTECSKLVKC